MRKCFFYLIAVFCSATGKSFAQANLSDSAIYRQAIQNSIVSYYRSVGENAHLYNGSEYVPYNFQGNFKDLYFESASLQNASIKYDGIIYYNVPLSYDIYHDEIIINKYNQNFRIVLANEKIDSFAFSGYSFIRIVKDSNNTVLPTSGFYQELYNGTVKVLAKRRKKLFENVTAAGATADFIEDDQYFIKKKGTYYPVHNKKSTLQVFKDGKKEVQKLLRKNKIKFKPNLESGIIKAAQYYDQTQN